MHSKCPIINTDFTAIAIGNFVVRSEWPAPNIWAIVSDIHANKSSFTEIDFNSSIASRLPSEVNGMQANQNECNRQTGIRHRLDTKSYILVWAKNACDRQCISAVDTAKSAKKKSRREKSLLLWPESMGPGCLRNIQTQTQSWTNRPTSPLPPPRNRCARMKSAFDLSSLSDGVIVCLYCTVSRNVQMHYMAGAVDRCVWPCHSDVRSLKLPCCASHFRSFFTAATFFRVQTFKTASCVQNCQLSYRCLDAQRPATTSRPEV